MVYIGEGEVAGSMFFFPFLMKLLDGAGYVI